MCKEPCMSGLYYIVSEQIEITESWKLEVLYVLKMNFGIHGENSELCGHFLHIHNIAK